MLLSVEEVVMAIASTVDSVTPLHCIYITIKIWKELNAAIA